MRTINLTHLLAMSCVGSALALSNAFLIAGESGPETGASAEAAPRSISAILEQLPDRDAKAIAYEAADGQSQSEAKPADGAEAETTAAETVEPVSTFDPFGDPAWSHWDLGWLTLDFGAQWRYRFHYEDNLRLNGQDDSFLLRRTRLWTDVNIGGLLLGRLEVIDAISHFEDLPPRFIDENRWDLLNAWGEVTIWNPNPETRIAFRAGRQELLYGSQRLISPLDWANTRRTFEGYRLYGTYGPFSLDLFWVRPFPPQQHVNLDHNLDNSDQSQEFSGIWGSYKGENCIVDIYFLRLKEQDNIVYGRSEVPGDWDVNTIGGRWTGNWGNWLYDFEGGVQFGDYADLNWQDAGFWTAGLGYRCSDWLWQPEFWVFYDWASGDEDPFDGERNTAFQYFPFGHYYLGWADLVGRQNIKDWNFRLSAKPLENVVLTAWYHIYRLEEARDALYNAAGVPIRRDITGAAGKDVGQELDLTILWNVFPGHTLLFGYSRFYAGDFLANTGNGDDADFFYTQWVIEWPGIARH